MKRKIIGIVLTLLVFFSFSYAHAEEEIVAIQNSPSIAISKGNNNSIMLSWNEIENANGYKVFRSDKKKGKYKQIANVTTTSYANTGLTYGKTYYYKVTAYNTKSSKASGIVSKKVVPNKVNNLVLSQSSSNKIKLSWDKVSVTGYEVYRSTNNKKWSKLATIKKSGTITYTNKVETNMKYYYKVRAYKTIKGKKIYGPYSNVSDYTIVNLSEGEKLLKNVKMPLWTKDYNLYFTGNKVLASKIPNDSKILLAVTKYQAEHTSSFVQSISKKNVENELKKIFGSKVKVTHRSYELGACHGHAAKYSKNKYTLWGGCGGPGPVDAYTDKVVSVNKYSDRIEVVEKVIYKSYPDWDFNYNEYTLNLYTNMNKKSLLGSEKESMDGNTTFNIDNYLDKLDSYKYIFKKSGKSYYFYSVEKI